MKKPTPGHLPVNTCSAGWRGPHRTVQAAPALGTGFDPITGALSYTDRIAVTTVKRRS